MAARKTPSRSDRITGRKMEKVMHEFKRGELKSGGSGKTVRSKKQAVAIGLSEARRAGARIPKVPKKRAS